MSIRAASCVFQGSAARGNAHAIIWALGLEGREVAAGNAAEAQVSFWMRKRGEPSCGSVKDTGCFPIQDPSQLLRVETAGIFLSKSQ